MLARLATRIARRLGQSRGHRLIPVLGALAFALASNFLLPTGIAAGEEPIGTPFTMNITTVTPGGPTVTPTPTSQPPSFITNNSGETAIFMYLTGGSGLASAFGPVDCGAPVYYQQGQVSNSNWAFIEVLWPAACVDPETSPAIGEKVTIGYGGGFKRLFSQTFRSEFPTETFVNNTGAAVERLNVEPLAGSIGEPFVVEQPPGCPAPAFLFEPLLNQGSVEIVWAAMCVGPGEQVTLHLPGAFPGAMTSHSWKPASVPVGGVSSLPALQLATEGSTGGNVGLLAGVIAGVTAGAVALGGAAWWARRRWLR